MGEHDDARVLVLQLVQAAPPAAVAQRLPFRRPSSRRSVLVAPERLVARGCGGSARGLVGAVPDRGPSRPRRRSRVWPRFLDRAMVSAYCRRRGPSPAPKVIARCPIHSPPRPPRRKRTPILRRFDAWMDSSLFGSRAARGQRRGSASSSPSRRLRRRPARGAGRSRVAGEGFTLGVAGTVVMLAFAIPVFSMTRGDAWRSPGRVLHHLPRPLRARRSVSAASSTAIRCRLRNCPTIIVKSVLSTEDRRFYDHYGHRSARHRARPHHQRASAGGVAQGGSTLTTSSSPRTCSCRTSAASSARIKEAYLALWLEANLTKNEILRLYLDRAFMGGGTHGVSRGGRVLFRQARAGRHRRRGGHAGGPVQGALEICAARQPARAPARAPNEVLSNLVEAGFMSEGPDRPRPGASRADVVDRDTVEIPRLLPRLRLYRVARFRDPRGGPDRAVLRGAHQLRPGAAGRVRGGRRPSSAPVRRGFRRLPGRHSCSCPPTARCAPIVGGRDYGESQYKPRHQRAPPARLGLQALRLYALAMQNGYRPDSVIRDEPVTINGWSPRNYGRSFSGQRHHDGRAGALHQHGARAAGARSGLVRTSSTSPMRMGVETDLRPDKTLPLRHVGRHGHGHGDGLHHDGQWRLRARPARLHPDHRP